MTASHPQATAGATRADQQPAPENASTGQLIGQLTEQISRLVRDEARLAQAEVTQKAKRLGVGAGLFGGAGLFAFFGLAVLITTAVLALDRKSAVEGKSVDLGGRRIIKKKKE